MKKVLILLLTVAFVLGTTGMALATDDECFCDWANGAKVKGDILKVIVFENDASAFSGVVDAVGNASDTEVNSISDVTASDDDSAANNDTNKKVENKGDVDAKTADADAFNQANNSEEQTITETAEAKVKDFVDAEIAISLIDGYVDSGSLDGHDDDCDCCPATVKGDIESVVVFNNNSFAASGDISAVGNASSTAINTADDVVAVGDTTASNKSDITVKNEGNVTARTGEAVSTNEANNWVCIDIFRGALTEKTCNTLIELFLESYAVE